MTENLPTTFSPVKKVSSPKFDDDKNTTLHFAAAAGRTEQVVELIQNGHKIDPENYLGWTPLMMATRNGHFETVQALLENRADATRRNRFGMTTFLISVASGNQNIVHLLLQHLLCGGVSKQSMESLVSPISIAVLFKLQDVFTYLLQQSFNINMATPSTGITPIMYAATQGSGDFYNTLVSKGADQQKKNYINQSAVDILHTKPNIIFPQKQCLQHNVPQMVLISPQPQYLNYASPPYTKSSDVGSPFFFPPNLTPVTPIPYTPQVFFPQEFTPTQLMSPQIISPVYHNDFLNARFSQNFLSPMPMNIPSPMLPSMPLNWIQTSPMAKTSV